VLVETLNPARSINLISQLRDVTCHMGSHSVTWHPIQVNAPHLNSASKLVLDLPTPERWKAELPRLPGNAPAGSRTRNLSITSPSASLLHYRASGEDDDIVCVWFVMIGHCKMWCCNCVVCSDGRCVPYDGTVCRHAFGVSSSVYVPASVADAVTITDSLVASQLDRLELTSQCRNLTIGTLCRYAFPDCAGTVGDVNFKSKPLCRQVLSVIL